MASSKKVHAIRSDTEPLSAYCGLAVYADDRRSGRPLRFESRRNFARDMWDEDEVCLRCKHLLAAKPADRLPGRLMR